MKHTDVLVIGAGPAGLAASIVFARSGLKTIICEKKPFPRDKACGEGIMPHGVTCLHKLGASSFIAGSDYSPFRGIRYHSPLGLVAEGTFHDGTGWGMQRLVLSEALLQTARRLPSLTICEETSAYPVEQTEKHIVTVIGKEKVTARFLVGADGLNSQVRRWAGLEGRKPFRQRWGTSQHFHLPPWSDFVEVFWGNGIEAYITPLRSHLVGAAFLWNPKTCSKLEGGANLLASLLSPFPALKKRLFGSSLAGKIHSVGPLQRNTTAVAANHLVLIGDAAGYIDAITGEGISLAFAQSLALEKTIVPLLQSGSQPVSAAQMSAYISIHEDLYRSYRWKTNLALFFSGRPKLSNLAVRWLAVFPKMFQRLISD